MKKRILLSLKRSVSWVRNHKLRTIALVLMLAITMPNPANGQWGGNALYGDFRKGRRPLENFNIGRNFRIKERMSFQIRAEFVNIFNRTYLGTPSTTNPLAPPSHNSAGQINGGFGTINATVPPHSNTIPSAPTSVNGSCTSSNALCGLPRTGTLIARFTF